MYVSQIISAEVLTFPKIFYETDEDRKIGEAHEAVEPEPVYRTEYDPVCRWELVCFVTYIFHRKAHDTLA